MYTLRLETLKQIWNPLNILDLSKKENEKIIKRMFLILESWKETPYMTGQQIRKKAVDCIRFVTAVYDELYRKTSPTICPRVNRGFATHNPQSAMKVMRTVLKQYPNHEIVKDPLLEPGDLILVGPPNGGPAHPMIVGPQKNTIWHCMKPKVMRTGWGIIKDEMKIFRILRAKDRKKWL